MKELGKNVPQELKKFKTFSRRSFAVYARTSCGDSYGMPEVFAFGKNEL